MTNINKNNLKGSSVSVDNYKGVPLVNYNSIIGESDSQIEIDGKIYEFREGEIEIQEID